jgi:hypothetical protein
VAFTPVTITGQVNDSAGNPSTVNGTIQWQLSQNGNCTSGSFAVAAGTYVVGSLVNGTITGTLNVIGNDDITPAGTFWTYLVVGNDGNIIARRYVTVLIANGASQAINTLVAAALPFSAGAGVPATRLVNTTAPLSGGGDLSADRTLSVSTSPSSGSAVGTGRMINTTAPLTGGGDLSADRTLAASTVTSVASGIVPSTGGGTANFLRADVSWAVPVGTPASWGGVNAQTASYPAVAGDDKKLISMNGASLTLTLPSPPPASTWQIGVENVNSTALTISRNGLNIDGNAANLTINQNAGTLIYTDGTNYFTSRGAFSSPLSTKGDIYTFGTADTRIGVGTFGQILNPDTSQTTGLKWVASANSLSTPGDPGAASGAAVMMGLAGALTPTRSGNASITISGSVNNSIGTDTVTLQIRFGTGSAPVNGAAVTGTAIGAAPVYTIPASGGKIPYSISAIATGLALGTAIWIDLSLGTNAGNGAIFKNTIAAFEI